MGKYELVIIASSKVEGENQKKLIDKIKESITKLKGKVIKAEVLGKRDLSYPIKKHSQGFLVEIRFSLNEDDLAEVDGKLKTNENILRHLLIKDEGKE